MKIDEVPISEVDKALVAYKKKLKYQEIYMRIKSLDVEVGLCIDLKDEDNKKFNNTYKVVRNHLTRAGLISSVVIFKVDHENQIYVKKIKKFRRKKHDRGISKTV